LNGYSFLIPNNFSYSNSYTRTVFDGKAGGLIFMNRIFRNFKRFKGFLCGSEILNTSIGTLLKELKDEKQRTPTFVENVTTYAFI